MLLQNSVSQPGFDFYSHTTCQSLQKSPPAFSRCFACPRAVVIEISSPLSCSPSRRISLVTIATGSCWCRYAPPRCWGYTTLSLWGLMGTPVVPHVRSARVYLSRQQMSSCTAGTHHSALPCVSALHTMDAMTRGDQQWDLLVKYWYTWVRVPFKRELQSLTTRLIFHKILFKIFGSSMRQ